MRKIGGDGRIEEVDLNDKGSNYLEETGDETVALALQIGAKTVLSANATRIMAAEREELKTMSVGEAISQD